MKLRKQRLFVEKLFRVPSSNVENKIKSASNLSGVIKYRLLWVELT